MSTTVDQYNAIVNICKDIYYKKFKDYGTSWRLFRPVSIADQIYIKAWRIRQLQEMPHGEQKIEDSIESEFKAIINYAIMALIQLELPSDTQFELDEITALSLYEKHINSVRDLMLLKNHDYGEAWRNLSQPSFVDLILTKLVRIKQIIANQHQTLVSEGADANFADIINYAIFALILLNEQNNDNDNNSK